MTIKKKKKNLPGFVSYQREPVLERFKRARAVRCSCPWIRGAAAGLVWPSSGASEVREIRLGREGFEDF